ncbi:unnamed protein product, partial [Darwinula stevensoni]
TPPCYAFNYRESDGSCQLVLNGKSDLVEDNGFTSYVQRLCLTEHPKIQNAKVSFEDWSGEYPAPPGGRVILRCPHSEGFSDGSQLHMAECSSSLSDYWCSSFKEDIITCKNVELKTPPCYAFNYRESDGSCQLVLNGKSDLVEDNGFTSYVQRLCLTEHPKIQNAKVSFEDWSGEYPAPPGKSLLKYPECMLTEKGREYVGKVSKTTSGKECLRWDTQPYGTPDDFLKDVTYFDHFSNLDTWSQKNYCRNPSGRERPWCFVMDAVEWEYCDIPMCTDGDPQECKITQKGGEYIGMKSVSHSGSTCQPWEIPWRITVPGMGTFFSPRFPDYKETAETHNFCRNPDGDVAPWCYIENRNRTFEFCDIPFCEIEEVQVGPEESEYPECRLTEKGKEYFGTKDVTETGKPCLNWKSQPYGMPWDFFNQEMVYSDHFINVDPAIHKNYCRNPALYREKPWCFVADSDIEWEYCDIPFCHKLEKPWCFVADSDIEWEYCDIPFCHKLGASLNRIGEKLAASEIEYHYSSLLEPPECKLTRSGEPPECKLTRSGGEYVGRRNTTISGYPCQHWLTRFPNDQILITKTLSAFPDEVDGSHNFCRNPDSTGHGPWCYSSESENTFAWEYCDVPFCHRTGEECDVRVSGNCISKSLHEYPECLLTEKGREYVGKVSKTTSGKECLRWDTQPYGTPDDFLKDVTYFDHFSNLDTWSQKNYCRNPSGRERPWCFVMDAVEWEYCDIPMCTDKQRDMGVQEKRKKGLEWPVTEARPSDYRCAPIVCIMSQKNYCRNPSGRERPWCFVMDAVEWEYCDIPMCTDKDPPECKITQKGGEYIGRKSVSHSGSTCQSWGIHWRITIPGMGTFFSPRFPDYKETAETHNFCRNPNGDVAPWCYIENRNRNFEFCDIPFCEIEEVQVGPEESEYPECRLTEKGKEYIGTKDVTETGKPCLNWDSQLYGIPWDFFNQKIVYSDHFINVDPAIHKNYCRNPALYREKPWCFVADSDIEWEYCDIPFCHKLEPPECKLTRSGGEYVGRRNTTISGYPCQYWLTRFPNDHTLVIDSLSAFPDEVDGSHNFCRNPDSTGHGPWCNTWQSDTLIGWEYCDVPFCHRTEEPCDVRVSGNCISPLECKTNRKGDGYIGTKNITASGHTCMPWMKRPSFEVTSFFYVQYKLFPDDLHPSHNFCRNPNGDKNGHWCYYGPGTVAVMDYCDIKDC